MGLDMSLYKLKREQRVPDNIWEVAEEVMYWRKANQIHNWFVENVQRGLDDESKNEVSKEKLMQLQKLIDEVIEDNSKAEELLPSLEGLFYGDTEYNERYFKQLRGTKRKLKKVIDETDFNSYKLIYHSSW